MKSIRLYSQAKHNHEISRLIHGYQRFRARYFNNPDNDLYRELVESGQKPKTMVIACSDSRVDPSIILNCAPGQLFVVRNVANLVPPFDNDPKHHGTSAALEFAVKNLKVQNIIVLGHSHCGGIRGLLVKDKQAASSPENNFISSWMSIAKEARGHAMSRAKHQTLEQQAKICEEYSLVISLQNLESFPWIKEKVEQHLLSLHAWRFDLANGLLQRFNPDSKYFENLMGNEPGYN